MTTLGVSGGGVPGRRFEVRDEAGRVEVWEGSPRSGLRATLDGAGYVFRNDGRRAYALDREGEPVGHAERNGKRWAIRGADFVALVGVSVLRAAAASASSAYVVA